MKITKAERELLISAIFHKYLDSKRVLTNMSNDQKFSEKERETGKKALEHLTTTYETLKEKLINEVPTDGTKNDSLEQVIDNYLDAYETYEAYADQCNVVEEHDDYRSGAIIEDAPDADFFIADMLEYVSNELGELSNSDREYCSKYFRDRFDSGAQDQKEVVIEHYSD